MDNLCHLLCLTKNTWDYNSKQLQVLHLCVTTLSCCCLARAEQHKKREKANHKTNKQT